MRRDVESFLQKKMSRKEFLKHIGLIVLSVFGIANALNYLVSSGNFKSNVQQTQGYGTNPYGGAVAQSRSFFR